MGLVGRRLQDHASGRFDPRSCAVGIDVEQPQLGPGAARPGLGQQAGERVGVIGVVGVQLQDGAAVGAAQDGEIAGGLEGLPAEDSLMKFPGAVHVGNEQVEPQPAQAAPEGNGVDPVEIHGHGLLAAQGWGWERLHTTYADYPRPTQAASAGRGRVAGARRFRRTWSFTHEALVYWHYSGIDGSKGSPMPPRVSKTSALLLGFIASGFAVLLSLTLLERFVLGLMVTPATTTDEGAIRDTFAALRLLVGVLPPTLGIMAGGSALLALWQLLTQNGRILSLLVLASLVLPLGYNIFLADTAGVVSLVMTTSPGDDLDRVIAALKPAVTQHYIGMLAFALSLALQIIFVLFRPRPR